MTISHTGGVFSYLPHHLDLALEDSVGHSTCMSVLARRRAIMGLGLGLGLWLGYHGVVGGFLACCHGRWGVWWVLGGGVSMFFLPHRCGDSALPVAAPRQDRLGCTIDPMIALRRANTLMRVLFATNRVFRREIQVVG